MCFIEITPIVRKPVAARGLHPALPGTGSPRTPHGASAASVTAPHGRAAGAAALQRAWRRPRRLPKPAAALARWPTAARGGGREVQRRGPVARVAPLAPVTTTASAPPPPPPPRPPP
jgi:hypothetical protein